MEDGSIAGRIFSKQVRPSVLNQHKRLGMIHRAHLQIAPVLLQLIRGPRAGLLVEEDRQSE